MLIRLLFIATESVVLLYDNARPDVSGVAHVEQAKFKWEQLDHPPYSLDMSPCDFHVFGHLKKHLKGKRFNSDDELKDVVKDWVSSRSQEFWEQGIIRLVNQWVPCAQAYGKYFEQRLHLYPQYRFVPFHLNTPGSTDKCPK
ncbi:histone-lysine N-methyltransferase SETMAR [Trichonephila inaurata madagascariensis]|uniref:Histone-lysine N-methyltransferase SETMAR n=1 Tax=Trichonephila inaurata madagascariensis TaxID=2747483 RepID=A0A8X6XKI5_9ARAC|nr:histone-lysine N-methyltransferase SETMAR [Trichonephila inaurata madagascariensis]